MIWRGVSIEGHKDLHPLANSTLTEVLRPTVRPYTGVEGPGFQLVQNDANFKWSWCGVTLNQRMQRYQIVPHTVLEFTGRRSSNSQIHRLIRSMPRHCWEARGDHADSWVTLLQKLDQLSVFSFDFWRDFAGLAILIKQLTACYTVKIFNLNILFIKFRCAIYVFS